MKNLTTLLILILIISGPSFANKVNIFEFTDTELSELEVRKVRGADNKTEYSVGSNDNGTTFTFLKEDEMPLITDVTNVLSKAISGITEAYSTIRMVVNTLWTTTHRSLGINHLRFTGDIIDANTTEHTVTVANGVFVIDGVSKPEITFTNGETYIFDQSDSTNANNTLVIGTTFDVSSSIVSSGLTIMGTPGQPGAYAKYVSDGSTVHYFSYQTENMGYAPIVQQ